MARKKKIEGETLEQEQTRKLLETIANAANRSEKMSWNRKMDNMVTLIAKLRPIEEQITDLLAQKQPIFDEVAALRSDMVKECVHPYTHLVTNQTVDGQTYVQCKFCNRRFNVPTSQT